MLSCATFLNQETPRVFDFTFWGNCAGEDRCEVGGERRTRGTEAGERGLDGRGEGGVEGFVSRGLGLVEGWLVVGEVVGRCRVDARW